MYSVDLGYSIVPYNCLRVNRDYLLFINGEMFIATLVEFSNRAQLLDFSPGEKTGKAKFKIKFTNIGTGVETSDQVCLESTYSISWSVRLLV